MHLFCDKMQEDLLAPLFFLLYLQIYFSTISHKKNNTIMSISFKSIIDPPLEFEQWQALQQMTINHQNNLHTV